MYYLMSQSIIMYICWSVFFRPRFPSYAAAHCKYLETASTSCWALLSARRLQSVVLSTSDRTPQLGVSDQTVIVPNLLCYFKTVES